MDRKLAEARAIALKKKIIDSPTQLEISKAKNKRFAIIKDGKRVNFGVWPYTGAGTYLDHSDNKIRTAWRARHSAITLKDGRKAYLVPGTAEYYAWEILW
jgi:hypothetical protein